MFGEVTPDAGWVESQIGVLKSLNVAAYVVKQLRLADDPAFIEFQPRIVRQASCAIWLDEPPNLNPMPSVPPRRLVHCWRGLQVKRIGPSYMIQIDFRST